MTRRAVLLAIAALAGAIAALFWAWAYLAGGGEVRPLPNVEAENPWLHVGATVKLGEGAAARLHSQSVAPATLR